MSPEELDFWMSVPAKDTLTFQRPLPDDALRIVAWAQKQDGLPEDASGITGALAESHLGYCDACGMIGGGDGARAISCLR